MHAYVQSNLCNERPRSSKFCCGYLRLQALAQCEMTLSSLGIVRINADDTALAAQVIIVVFFKVHFGRHNNCKQSKE